MSISSPDNGGHGEVVLTAGGVGNFILKNSFVNPSGGISTAAFNTAGTYLVSYNQNAATGTVVVYGDYQLAGSTLSLDYANNLYSSTATTPMDMSGHGNSASINSTYDANAVSQLVTATYNGATWDIAGSSTGVLCSGVGTSATDCPSGANKQFNITLTKGGSVTTGDVVNFALIAVSSDTNVQKELLFGPAAGTYNNGSPKIEIAPNAGLHAVGQSAASPSLISMLSGGGTYYTFVFLPAPSQCSMLRLRIWTKAAFS